MPALLTDPTSLLTKLHSSLANSNIPPGASPIVDAARQRLQGTQQDLLGQNLMMQQQQQQMRLQRQQQARMQRTLAALQAAQAAQQSLPMGAQRNYQGAYNPAGAAPGGQIRNWINQALQITGHTGNKHAGLVNGLYQMIMHESGGNPTAMNGWDSNAKAGTPSIGLMQTIQPTFDAYALAGHRHIRNPVDNIIAGLRYALRNYGYHMVMAGGRHDANGNYLGY